MNIQKSRVNTQLTLDDDYNIPETMGDVFKLLIDQGRLQTEEVKVSEDHVTVKGRLHFSALYLSENHPKNIQNINGSIPFEEFIHMEGIESGDNVKVTGEIENLSLSLINSRKLSIKAINSLALEVEGGLRVKNSEIRMLQVCHSSGTVVIDDTEIVENGIAIEGAIDVQILYVTTDDRIPFYTIKGSIPFAHTVNVQGIDENCIYTIDVTIEQLAANMIDSEELEIRAVCDVQALVFKTIREDIISEIECHDADMDKMSRLPGIVGYIAKQGDTLWQIGKKYYVPIKQIKETNGLTSEELHPGDKLLIVKTIGRMSGH